MQEVTTTTVSFPSTASQDVLTEVLRQGAHAMLTTAIEAEVAQWIGEQGNQRGRSSNGINISLNWFRPCILRGSWLVAL